MRLSVFFLVAALLSTPALAGKKKGKRHRGDTLSVVVLTFSGKGTGGADTKEAVELELDLVEMVQVNASDAVENDLRGAGKRAWDPPVLSAILQKRGVDVLVRGERGLGEKSQDALLITAYGKDGQPRYYKEAALGGEPETMATSIVADVKPSLSNWKSLKPIKIGGAGDADEDDKPSAAKISASDVLADDDPDKHKKPAERAAVVKRGSVLDDDDPPAKPADAKKVVDKKDRSGASPLDFNSDDRPKSKSKIDEDSPNEERIARSEIDDSGRKHSVIDETDTEPKPEQPAKLGHAFAVSGAFDGSTWYYGFDGGGVGDTQLNATFYPGGSALVDAWPLSFAGINWVGVDGELGVAAVPFKFQNDQNVQVTPNQFTAIQARAAVALKLRYTLKNGIGLGLRAGYRFYGATVQPQTIDVNGQTQGLTVVPGYKLHAAAVGAEVFLPILIGNHRLELEVRADGLPITYYDESPDNPGETTLAFGWAASLAARYDIASGFFGEARAQSTGTQVTYTGKGSRFALVGQGLKQLQGGSVLNLTAGFSIGVGFMF